MTIEIQAHTGNMKIDSYNLAEFLAEIQEGFLKGFRLDFKTNENYPFGSGSYYSTTLVPESQQAAKEKLKNSVEIQLPAELSTDSATPDQVATKNKLEEAVTRLREGSADSIVLPDVVDPETKEQLFQLKEATSSVDVTQELGDFARKLSQNRGENEANIIDALSVVHKDEAVVPMARRGRKPGK
jgi:hypothetical protein